MSENILSKVEETETESADLDFKASFDPNAAQDWCELIKDIVAMANSGGGLILIGVNDDGSPATADLRAVRTLDPARIVDKVAKYTDHGSACCSVHIGSRRQRTVVVLSVSAVDVPIVFTSPGTYDVGGGKQKTAFAKGTVYFRHGPKSEPGTSEDLRAALNRELDRIRSSWLDGIRKVVTAPVGATISVIPADVQLSQTEESSHFRLVTDDKAPAFKAVRTDVLYPYRQKELVARVNRLLADHKITAHDIHCVRKVHQVHEQPTFFYQPQFSSPQYSETFAQWIVEQFRADPEFFLKSRDASRKQPQ